MTTIQNWPIWAVQGRFYSNPNRPPTDKGLAWLDFGTERVVKGEWAQGRQYELNAVETGVATFTLDNRDEAWSPDNPSAPANLGGQSLVPRRMFRVWAAWPLTGNILNSTVSNWARSVDTSTFEGGTVGDWVPTSVGTGGVPTVAVSTVRAHSGTKSLLVTWPTDATHTTAAGADLPPTKGTQTYTLSCYVWVPTGSPNVMLQTASGQTSAASSGNNAWVRISVTWTPTSPFRNFYVVPVTGTTSGQQVWVDDVQLEFGSSASAFTTTGPVIYAQHTGYIAKYPERWSHNGYFGWSDLQSNDGLSLLPTIDLFDSYTEELTVDEAAGIWPIADSNHPEWYGILQTSRVMTPGWGSNPAAVLPNMQERSVGNPADLMTFGQTGGPSVDGFTCVDYTTGTSTDHRYIYADIYGAGLTVVDTGAGTSMEVWFKTTATSTQYILVGIGSGNASWEILLTSTGHATFRETNNGGSTFTYNVTDPSVALNDGVWHQAVITESSDGTTVTMSGYIDGELRATGTRSSSTSFAVLGMASYTAWWSPTTGTFQGQMAWVSVYAQELTAARVATHYNAMYGFPGESVTDRLERFLSWSGLLLSQAIDSTSNPCAKLSGVSGQKIPDLIQPTAATDNGVFFADPYGVLTYQSRDHRYLQTTPLWVFGENTAGGELPYQPDLNLGVDDQFLFNEITVSSTSGVDKTGRDQTSQDEYFRQTASVNTAHSNPAEQQGLADHLINRYKDPHSRVYTLSLDASTDATLWPFVLGAKLGDRVRINRRTAVGVTITLNGFIERLERSVVPATGNNAWTVAVQVSPVDAQPWIIGDATYGIIGSTTRVVY